MNDLHWMTVAEAARAIATRKLSPVELMSALLERIGRLDPTLHVSFGLTVMRRSARQGLPRPRLCRVTNADRCMACRSASKTSSMSRACLVAAGATYQLGTAIHGADKTSRGYSLTLNGP